MYLTQRNWAAAATKAREVVSSGTYALLPNYADVFTPTNRNSRESIFEVQFFIGAQVGTGNFLGNNFFEQFAPTGSSNLVTGVPNSNGQGRNIPTSSIVNAYEASDPRRDASLRTAYVIPASGPNPARTVNINYTIKYQDPTATGGGSASLGAGSANGFRALRYADVLLVLAEALNEQGGGNAEAFGAVNQVRRRARGNADPATVLPDLAGLDQAAFRAAVERERRVELAFENHRWFDLLRLGNARALAAMAANGKAIQADRLRFPIPLRERQVNPNL